MVHITLPLPSVFRGVLTERKLLEEKRRREAAASLIQTNVRLWLLRRHAEQLVNATTMLQVRNHFLVRLTRVSVIMASKEGEEGAPGLEEAEGGGNGKTTKGREKTKEGKGAQEASGRGREAKARKPGTKKAGKRREATEVRSRKAGTEEKTGRRRNA